MPNDYFEFKKFKIKQDKCAMKVSTDAVLLGAWVSPEDSSTILDIGTGSGVIALMLAQRSNARITAIDIDKDSTDQASDNVAGSEYRSRIEVKHCSFQDLETQSGEKYDLIVTNPPYFMDSLRKFDDTRKIARDRDSLSFDDLINGVKNSLRPRGKFCLILPRNEALVFRDLAQQNGLYISKLLRVVTRPDKESEKRHLMQFEFKQSGFSESTLVIESEQQHEYTEEYKALTRDYYLHF